MLRIRITPQNIQQVQNQVQRLSGGVLTGFNFEDLIPAVAETIDRIFETEGNGTWQPLSPAYAAWKERNYPGRSILELTQTYRRAATTPDGQNNFIEITNDSLEYGVDGIPYAPVHEFGTDRIPARPVFALAADDGDLQDEVVRIVSDYLDNLDF